MPYQPNHLAKLEQRAEEIRAWLGDRLELISRLRAQRTADLLPVKRTITFHEMDAQAAAMKAQVLRERAAGLRAEADKLDAYAAMEDETQVAQLAQAALYRGDLAVKRGSWQTRLREIQDGRTRRKRHELQRLVDRIARKKHEQFMRAETHISADDIMYGKGLPEAYGVPEPAKQ